MQPSTTASPTTHIVSYVNQRKTKNVQKLKEFDFELINPSLNKLESKQAYVNQIQNNLDNNLVISTTTGIPKTDDLNIPNKQNTLENNEVFGNNEQHESSSPDYRAKQSIPVLVVY